MMSSRRWPNGPAGRARQMSKPEFGAGATAVHVELGRRSYEIVIAAGLLEEAGRRLRPLLRRPVTAIVTDENVELLHLATLEHSLTEAEIAWSSIVLPPG